MALNTVAYVESVRVVKQQITTAHEASLTQLKQIVDEQLRKIDKFSQQIAFLDRVRSLLYLDSELFNFHRFYIYRLIQDFRVYKLAAGIVDEFYVYFKRLGFGITSSAMYETERLYDFVHDDEEFTYYTWLDLMFADHNGSFVPVKRRSNEGIIVDSMAHVQSIPFGTYSEKVGTIVIMVDKPSLKNVVQGLKWVAGGTVQIIDGNGELLFSTGPKMQLRDDQYADLLERGTLDLRNSAGETVVLSAVGSEVNDWSYVSILPDRVFLQPSNYIGRIILLSLSLCLVVGIGVAYLFARINYYPLRKLLGLLPRHAQSGTDAGNPSAAQGSGNEYELLQSYVSDIVVKNEEYQDRIDKQKVHLKNRFLVRLLRGSAQKSISVTDGLDVYGIQFDYPYFMVMLFTTEGPAAVGTDSEEGLGEDGHHIVTALGELIREIRTDVKIESGDADGTVFCIVNLGSKSSDSLEHKIAEFAETVQFGFEKEYEVSLSIAMSDVHESLHGISVAYSEAGAALEYKLLMGERAPLVTYAGVSACSEMEVDCTRFLQYELKFINCIKAEDYYEARAILESLFTENFVDARLSLQMVKVRMFGLINTMVNAMSELTMHHEIQFLDSIDYAESLLKCASVVDLKQTMFHILAALDQYALERRQAMKDRALDDVISYVRGQFADVDLNVSQIADHFGLSVSYLSRRFKKETGIGLLDYIHTVRIDEAKALLEGSDLNVGEIGRRVGYYSDIAFIRAFKRYQGISPGKYRAVAESEAS
jgi:AraC-like DNA-binding protein